MLDTTVYSRDWERKMEWYAAQGYDEGVNLFTTSEVGGLQSKEVSDTINKVRIAIESG